MKTAYLNTFVLNVINMEKILERLDKCNTLLNTIQNGLNNYLEIMRLQFPRFFFFRTKRFSILFQIPEIQRGMPDKNDYLNFEFHTCVKKLNTQNIIKTYR